MNGKTHKSLKYQGRLEDKPFQEEAESEEDTGVLTGSVEMEATVVRAISEKPAGERNIGERRFRQLVLEILLKMGIKQQANGYPGVKSQGWASRLEMVCKRVTEC